MIKSKPDRKHNSHKTTESTPPLTASNNLSFGEKRYSSSINSLNLSAILFIRIQYSAKAEVCDPRILISNKAPDNFNRSILRKQHVVHCMPDYHLPFLPQPFLFHTIRSLVLFHCFAPAILPNDNRSQHNPDY